MGCLWCGKYSRQCKTMPSGPPEFISETGLARSTGLIWRGPYWLFIRARFPRSRLTSEFFVKFSMCSYERAGWLSSRDLGKRAGKFFHMNTSARPVTGMKAGWILRMNSVSSGADYFGIVLLCLLYFPHHKHSVSQQWYSYKSCQSYNRRES